MFNLSMLEGVFPEKMKLAEVVPLYKSKEKYLTNNYRPISLLITISKLLEKVIYKRTYSFLQATDQLYDSQYGFREGNSCENAISELVGEILKNKENNKFTVSLFLDWSKAFDSLKHSTLLKKMEIYGIRGNAYSWFNSYLNQRQLRAKCSSSTGNSEVSRNYDIAYGMPQGSCLGPLLFINNKISVKLCNQELPIQTSTKFLGVWLDNNLDWNKQFSHICSKLKQNTGLM